MFTPERRALRVSKGSSLSRGLMWELPSPRSKCSSEMFRVVPLFITLDKLSRVFNVQETRPTRHTAQICSLERLQASAGTSTDELYCSLDESVCFQMEMLCFIKDNCVKIRSKPGLKQVQTKPWLKPRLNEDPNRI